MTETKARRWRLVGGMHADGDARYKKGDVIETKVDMRKKWGAKFEEVPVDTPVTPQPVAPPPDVDLEDVTEKFPVAAKNNLLVKRGGRNYHVYEKKDQKNVLNEKVLASAKSVNEWLKKYLAE